MFGTPGSLTMYSRAERNSCLIRDESPSPADSFVQLPSKCKCIKESVAPFNNTEEKNRSFFQNCEGPSPNSYFPIFGWDHVGTPLMHGKGKRFPDEKPKNCYQQSDPLIKMKMECSNSSLKSFEPRVSFEKYVSNNIPSILHPKEMCTFLTGKDGRVYPWRRNRKFESCNHSEQYDPDEKLHTQSKEKKTSNSSYKPFCTDFGSGSKRVPLFGKEEAKSGFGPADFFPIFHPPEGGRFLSKTCSSEKESMPRTFDQITFKAIKENLPNPTDYKLRGSFDKESSFAVSAPFKSKTLRGLYLKQGEGPGPAIYFDKKMTLEDLGPRLYPFIRVKRAKKAPFGSCTIRKENVSSNSRDMPSPDEYKIKGFAESLNYNLCKHSPAIKNPNLGFLSTAKRSCQVLSKKNEEEEDGIVSDWQKQDLKFDGPKKWRNLRPKMLGKLYTYCRPPLSKHNNIPGPIYDVRPCHIATKGRTDFWDPRKFNYVAFNNSGGEREIVLSNDMRDSECTPGPADYFAKLPCCNNSTVIRKPVYRSKNNNNVENSGPGPIYKPHEKFGSSIWRATHLGTFNATLKGLIPPGEGCGSCKLSTGGGYQANGPIDELAEKKLMIDRHFPVQEPKKTLSLNNILHISIKNCSS